MNSQCLISFGSNLGDRGALIAAAARIIANSALSESFRASRMFETPPIGGPDGQETFLNAVAAFETPASARDVLSLLQQTENQLGRLRKQRWGARSIDLDVVLHGELIGGGTGLVVPHPRYTARRFVLQPACDVAPHYRDPRFGWTIQRLARHVSEGVPSLALIGGDAAIRSELCRRLALRNDIATFDAKPFAAPTQVIGTATAKLSGPSLVSSQISSKHGDPVSIDLEGRNIRWVSAFVPELPPLDSDRTSSPTIPRLIARIEQTNPETYWPAPHRIWPAGSNWPEYRLEATDIDWTESEILSALDSMRCPSTPVTDDGDWWK